MFWRLAPSSSFCHFFYGRKCLNTLILILIYYKSLSACFCFFSHRYQSFWQCLSQLSVSSLPHKLCASNTEASNDSYPSFNAIHLVVTTYELYIWVGVTVVFAQLFLTYFYHIQIHFLTVRPQLGTLSTPNESPVYFQFDCFLVLEY